MIATVIWTAASSSPVGAPSSFFDPGGEGGEVGVGVGGAEVAQPSEAALSVGRSVRLQCVQE